MIRLYARKRIDPQKRAETWLLFKSLNSKYTQPIIDMEGIIKNYINGRIVDVESFNLYGYNYSTLLNNISGRNKADYKKRNMIWDTESEQIYANHIVDDKAVDFKDFNTYSDDVVCDSIDSVDDYVSSVASVSSLDTYNQRFLMKGINLKILCERAIEGYSSAYRMIRSLCKEDEELGEILRFYISRRIYNSNLVS